MPHDTPLITTIVGGLVFAFALGALALRLRLPPLVGYLTAGILVGPFTPGFQADTALAPQLAELGVILLMFGVGQHFSIKDLLAVKSIAVPGALVQIAVATLLGMGLSQFLGWPLGESLVFGLALSVASTVVLLRALEEHGWLDSEDGKVAVGWLVVEDLVMVITLVLLPAFAGALSGGQAAPTLAQLGWTLALTVAKVAAFVVLMLVVGRRFIPWMLERIVHTGSRELFRLGVLATALGVAYGATQLFQISFALGAFFAGMVMAESPFSHRAAEESLPLREAFAVLFFVSVGMLLDPEVLLNDTAVLLATVLIIVLGKSLAAYGIVRLFRRSHRTSLRIAASLSQIGEFSFILAGLGMTLGLLSARGQALILAGAIVSILFNPMMFVLAERYGRRAESAAEA
ncbi:potassium transporter Kef [Chromobacterium phragmitis]|uniref:Cation:proton antiporter n=1 Tax=Chromobacterium phragmitis TaxID=2202141 RepID=A0A344UKC0_9NEIS|nr:cation:proton antiporter [Chromobacterium phragmitis]AXE30324.1 potassium transporter Kef [Chromobacterium phragmitis]AXE35718.1 potassium transporter Kef [Chromobacterium phragmitis]